MIHNGPGRTWWYGRCGESLWQYVIQWRRHDDDGKDYGNKPARLLFPIQFERPAVHYFVVCIVLASPFVWRLDGDASQCARAHSSWSVGLCVPAALIMVVRYLYIYGLRWKVHHYQETFAGCAGSYSNKKNNNKVDGNHTSILCKNNFIYWKSSGRSRYWVIPFFCSAIETGSTTSFDESHVICRVYCYAIRKLESNNTLVSSVFICVRCAKKKEEKSMKIDVCNK